MWDLGAQHCCQVVVGHQGEVWALAVSPDGTRLATGSTDAEVRMYAVEEEGGGWGEAEDAGPAPKRARVVERGEKAEGDEG